MVDSKNKWKAWLYLSPALILLAVFTVWPIFNTVRLAFLQYYNNEGVQFYLNGKKTSLTRELMKKNLNETVSVNDEEVARLLAEYNAQAAMAEKHGYSELFHSDYSNYRNYSNYSNYSECCSCC